MEAVWTSRRAAGKFTVMRGINTIAAGMALLIVLTTALLPQIRESWALITLAMVAMSLCVIVSMRTPEADQATPPEPVNAAPLAVAEATLAQIPDPTPAPVDAPEPEHT
jgi:outer membrane biosynthesis protein TonB